MSNKSNVLVYGIGIKGLKYPSKLNKIFVREYRAWSGMLLRCTEKEWSRKPTYINTTCSENFKNYSYFYEWCNKQTGFKNVDEKGKVWHLDKDLLVKGNKHYSEDVCVFVPQRINSLLISCKKSRGTTPVGVYWYDAKAKFISQCTDVSGESKHLGSYDTQEEAFQAYKVYKEALIKQIANEYKDRLDQRAYNALMNYEVNIND